MRSLFVFPLPVELLSVVSVDDGLEWSNEVEFINLRFLAAKSRSWSERILGWLLKFFVVVSKPIASLFFKGFLLSFSVFVLSLQRMSENISLDREYEFTSEDLECVSKSSFPPSQNSFPFLAFNSLHLVILLWLSGYVRLHWPSKSSTRSSSTSSSSLVTLLSIVIELFSSFWEKDDMLWGWQRSVVFSLLFEMPCSKGFELSCEARVRPSESNKLKNYEAIVNRIIRKSIIRIIWQNNWG